MKDEETTYEEIPHRPSKYKDFKIEKLTAFIVKDPVTGNEGVCAIGPMPEMMIPLVAAYPHLTEAMEMEASMIARRSHKEVMMIEFTARKVIKVLK